MYSDLKYSLLNFMLQCEASIAHNFWQQLGDETAGNSG